MKRFLAVLVLLCIVAASLWYYLQAPVVEVSADDFLPSETLITIEVHNLEKGINEFRESRLGKNLGKIDMTQLMRKLGAEEENIQEYSKGESRFFSTINSRGFMEIFGRELHLALLPPDDVMEKAEDLLNRIVIIAFPSHNTDLLQLAGGFFTGDREVGETLYEEHTIRSLKLEDDLVIHYCFTEGVMLSSFAIDKIKEAIGRRKSGAGNMLSNNYYTGLRRQVFKPDSRVFAYFNVEKLSEELKEIIMKKMPSGEGDHNLETSLDRQFDLYKGFRSVVYSSYDNNQDESSEKVLVNFDSSRLTPGQSATYRVEPGPNHTLAMVPAGTLFYSWANNLEIRHSLQDYLSREGMTDEQMTAIYKKIEEKTGATLDEIDKTLGGEIGFIWTDLKMGGLFPVPVFAAMVQVAETELVENFLTSLAADSGVSFVKENYDGVEIKKLALPLGNDFEPAYAFYEGFWITAVNATLIKEMMASRKSGKGLLSEESFKSVDKGLSGMNNGISYMKMDRFAEKIGLIAGWGRNMLSIKSPEAAEKVTILLDYLIGPVLEGMKMYKAIGTKTVIGGEIIEVDSYFKMESRAL